jgi:hypothetical protein
MQREVVASATDLLAGQGGLLCSLSSAFGFDQRVSPHACGEIQLLYEFHCNCNWSVCPLLSTSLVFRSSQLSSAHCLRFYCGMLLAAAIAIATGTTLNSWFSTLSAPHVAQSRPMIILLNVRSLIVLSDCIERLED